MGLWYSDPQPVQRAPRLPASAFTTGGQPPRKAVAGAIAMACVLAACPAEGEPRLTQQNLHPRQIAPQTLVYGQEPPRRDPITRSQRTSIYASWPDDREPRLQFNNQQPERRYIVALTLKYGSQPTPVGPLTVTETNKLVRWWDQPFQLQQVLPSAAVFFVAPVVNTPPPSGGLTASIVRRAWADPVIVAISVAGVIRITGPSDQPPPSGPLPAFADLALLRYSWEPAFQSPPMAAVAAIAFVAPVVNNPPIGGPLTTLEQSLIRFSWEPAFQNPESEANSAGWNVPFVAPSPFIPGNETPWWIGAAWRVPELDIQFSGNFTPDTLGDQPPPSGPLPVIPDYALLRGTWEPARSEPPVLVKVAPLTLVQGQQPLPTGPLTVTELQIIGTIAPWWPAQSENDNAGWNFTPPVVSQPTPFSAQLHLVRFSWEPPFVYPESEANNAGWNVPPVVNNPAPLARLRPHIVRAWYSDPQAPQRSRWFTESGPLVEIGAFSGELTVSARFSGNLVISPRFSGVLIVSPLFQGELDTDPE